MLDAVINERFAIIIFFRNICTDKLTVERHQFFVLVLSFCSQDTGLLTLPANHQGAAAGGEEDWVVIDDISDVCRPEAESCRN